MRKPPVRTAARRAPRVPLPSVRRQMWDQACELVSAGDKRDVAVVLANRFKVSRHTVHLVLIVEGKRHERAAVTFKNGLANVLSMVRQAEAAIEEEIFEAAS